MAEQKIFGITIGKKTPPTPENANTPKNALTTNPFTPKAPSVNYIPTQILEGYKISALTKKFGVLASIVILALAGTFVAGKNIEATANKNIRTVETEKLSLDTQTQSLAPFRAFFNDVDKKRQTINTQMNIDTAHHKIINEILTSADQSGVSVSNINIIINTTTSSATCPSPDPFNSVETIGCVTFSGTAPDRNAIIQFVQNLDNVPGFVNAYIPSSNASADQGSGISGSVGFDHTYYTGRFQEFTTPLKQAVTPTQTPPDTENPDDPDQDLPLTPNPDNNATLPLNPQPDTDTDANISTDTTTTP